MRRCRSRLWLTGSWSRIRSCRRQIYDAATDVNGDGARDLSFRRRLSEVGNRGSTADRDTFRVLGGFEGEIPVGENWKYEAFYAYGQTKEAQISGGQVNVLNFRSALEAVADVNDIDGDGDTAEAICASADARAEGCVPIDIFGHNSISAAAGAYVNAPSSLATFTSQKLAGLNLTGDVIDLPAGPLGVAFGIEYRDEFARTEFDPLTQAGLNAGNAIPRTEGQFDVLEEYLEVNVPILADLPFADQLNLRAAYRYSDYSTVGNTDSWNVGLEWAPIPQVRFRGIRAISTRAPNINELYSPASQTFPTGLRDPCQGVTATSTGTLDDNCRAAPGVAENIATNGAFTLNQADIQGISGFDSGNPNLGEEARQVVDGRCGAHAGQHRRAAQLQRHDRLLEDRNRAGDRRYAAPVHPRPVLPGRRVAVQLHHAVPDRGGWLELGRAAASSTRVRPTAAVCLQRPSISA